MVMRTKRRILRTHKVRTEGVRTSRSTGETTVLQPQDVTIYSRQITSSEGHAWPKGRGVRDEGGPFDTLKLEYRNSVLDDSALVPDLKWVEVGPYIDAAYEFRWSGTPVIDGAGLTGHFTLDGQTDDYYQSFVPSDPYGAVEGRGSELMSGAIPTNPVLDGSVALAELFREGLPSIVGGTLLKDRVGFLRGLGGEYLNYEFGWKPLVSDLKNAAKAVIDSSSVLAQLERDSGRNVRRRRYLPITRTAELLSKTTVYPRGSNSRFWRGAPWYRRTETIERSTWFSGCFTYYYEPSLQSEVERIVTQARLLYGIELTPEVVWNLTPWSWLIDWVTNVGPVLHNLSAFQSDQLVLRYGYVMEKTSRTYSQVTNYTDLTVPGRWPSVIKEEYSGIRKIRRAATPYGFGMDTGMFDTRQWAILTALGITRR